MKLLFAGDFVTQFANPSISQNLKSFIKKHDYAIVNFEGAICDEMVDRRISKIGSYVCNRLESVKLLSENGFTVAALANNHIMDFGVSALDRTLSLFAETAIRTVGAGHSFQSVYKPLHLKSGNETACIVNACQAEFGVLKFCTSLSSVHQSGYAWIGSSEIEAMILSAKEKGLYVIVYIHAGLEHEPYPLPEWQRRYRELVDNGADCIVANHPHIMQGMETYRGRNIYYSLGNFYFPKLERKDDKEWNRSYLVSIDTETNEQKVVPVFFDMSGQVDLAEDRAEFAAEFSARSRLLNSPIEFERYADTLAEQMWEQTYCAACAASVGVDCKRFLPWLLKKLLCITPRKSPKTVREDVVLHNSQIETHRYLIERYLYNQNIRRNHLD